MSTFKRKDRSNWWWFRVTVKLPDGTRKKLRGRGARNTKAHAEKAEREAIERAINPRTEPEPVALAPTVTEYAASWIARRSTLGLVTWQSDDTRLRLHALPHIGGLRVDEVKPRHIRDLVLALRSAGKLAPRTILKVSATLHSMFKSALIEELTIQNPVVLEAGVLPKKADRDPEWRHNAVYTRDEIESLISDDRIPADRRVLYALKCLAALRHAEASELMWRQLDTVTKPLGRILLGETKSGVPRAVPIHPTLGKMLATWRLSGWFNTYGRQPTADDLIVPTLTLKRRTPKEAQDALVGDLKLLGRPVRAGSRMNRRGHDLRRTFVSLAQADGARRDVIEWGTHGPRGDIMSMYTSMPWPTICDEWSKLKIELHEGALVSLQHDKPTALTVRARKRWLKVPPAKIGTPAGHQSAPLNASDPQPAVAALLSVVTPKGLEPLFSA